MNITFEYSFNRYLLKEYYFEYSSKLYLFNQCHWLFLKSKEVPKTMFSI